MLVALETGLRQDRAGAEGFVPFQPDAVECSPRAFEHGDGDHRATSFEPIDGDRADLGREESVRAVQLLDMLGGGFVRRQIPDVLGVQGDTSWALAACRRRLHQEIAGLVVDGVER